MTTFAPPPPHLVRNARATLLNAQLMTSIHRDHRADLVAVAFGILRDARAARLAVAATPEGLPRVTHVTTAEFRQGRLSQHHRPRLVVTPTGPTPGDAA